MRLRASSRFLRRAEELARIPRRRCSARCPSVPLRRGSADPLLRTHKLKGELADYWAFSIDEDLRVLFRWERDVAFLVNLGTHDECGT